MCVCGHDDKNKDLNLFGHICRMEGHQLVKTVTLGMGRVTDIVED